MLISVHTDNHIQGRADVVETVQSMVADALGDFSSRLTRVEIHLSDENGGKGGENDKRCLIDAHPKRSAHIAIHYKANTVKEAIDGALEKLMTVLHKFRDKRIDKRHRPGPVKTIEILAVDSEDESLEKSS